MVTPLHRILDLEIAPLDRELVCEVRCECLDAEPLRCVMAGRDQVNTELPGRGLIRLLRLAARIPKQG